MTEPDRTPPHLKLPLAARIIPGVFGAAFAGIGLCVIGFLWFGNDDFHDPPIFFKLVGSLIATVFVVMGGTMAYSAITARGLLANGPAPDMTTMPGQSAGSPRMTPGPYTCPNCGAGLGQEADVSPLGDVKCPFCGRWFNVHGKS
jgi:hypothetical protein